MDRINRDLVKPGGLGFNERAARHPAMDAQACEFDRYRYWATSEDPCQFGLFGPDGRLSCVVRSFPHLAPNDFLV